MKLSFLSLVLSEMQNIKDFGPKAIDQDRVFFHTSGTKRVFRPSEKPARVQRRHAIRLGGLAGRGWAGLSWLGWAAPGELLHCEKALNSCVFSIICVHSRPPREAF